jgi:putative ABC transport system permease protein
MEALPGVNSAGADGGGANVFFQPQGQPPAAPGQEPTAALRIITPDFLKAMGTHLIAGRAFSEHDNESGAPVAIISETVARRYWPDSSPIGAHVTILARVYSGQQSGASRFLQIVGVAQDVRNDDLWRPEPAIYVPFAQSPVPSVFLAVRTAVPPMTVVPELRQAVQAVDREQPINGIRSMDEMVAQNYGAIRFPMTLLWIFSGLALLLSAVGIFGVMSYTVTRRTRELAVRMALGASRQDVLGLVLREGLWVTLFGVGVGLVGALGLGRIMAQYLYGISSTDPLTLASASVLLILVALLAAYLPARKAAKVDPLVALRYE